MFQSKNETFSVSTGRKNSGVKTIQIKLKMQVKANLF